MAEYDEAIDFKVKKVFGGSLLRVLRDVREQADRLNDVSAVIDGKPLSAKRRRLTLALRYARQF